MSKTNTNTSTNTASTHGHSGAGSTAGTDNLVKTGEYSTGLEHGSAPPGTQTTNAVPIVGDSHQNRISGVANTPGVVGAPGAPGSGDGLVVNNGLGGPLGGSVVLGGQCECTMNGGSCQHGAGKCMCRGCTTRATTVNPGINIGVSTTQYTAPVGTTGIGGGVADPGVGIAGLVHSQNASGQQVNPSDSNCACVKKTGSCQCAPGACSCENCQAKKTSMQHTQAARGTDTTTHGHHHQHHHQHHTGSEGHHQRLDQGGVSNIAPLGGSEYASHTSNNPDAAYKSSTTNTPAVNTAGSNKGPVTDNTDMNSAYKKGDYTEGKPITKTEY